MKKRDLLVVLLFIPALSFGQQDVEIIPANGTSFVVKESGGSVRTLEVTSDGRIILNGKEADFVPPDVTISAPDMTDGNSATVSVTFTDDKGLFKVLSETPDQGKGGTLFAEEKLVNVVYQTLPQFGKNTIVEAYAIDLAGNTTTATHTISSDTAIKTGTYILSPPLNLNMTGQGCGMGNYSPLIRTINTVLVNGRYHTDPTRKCDSNDSVEVENPVACLEIFLNWEVQSPFQTGIRVALPTFETMTFAKSNQKGSWQSGAGYSWQVYVDMTGEFFGGPQPAFTAQVSFRCSSLQYGSESYGPFLFNATLQ